MGSGPGDPGLLTVRARETLVAAPLVVTDPDVPEAVLAIVSPDAEVRPAVGTPSEVAKDLVAQAWRTALDPDGVAPDMQDVTVGIARTEPAWRTGRLISLKPARGPEESSRRSLPVLDSFTATRIARS